MAQGVIILLVFVSIEENLATYVLHQTNTDVDNCSIISARAGENKAWRKQGRRVWKCQASYHINLGPVIQRVDTCYPMDKWLSRRSVLTKCTVLSTG